MCSTKLSGRRRVSEIDCIELYVLFYNTNIPHSPPTPTPLSHPDQAFYSLTNTKQQITAHVYDVMRSQLPTLELDAVFEAKEDLALAVKNALQETMSEYGYQVSIKL